MWQYDATVKKIVLLNKKTRHSVILKFSTIKKLYNIRTKIITENYTKNKTIDFN